MQRCRTSRTGGCASPLTGVGFSSSVIGRTPAEIFILKSRSLIELCTPCGSIGQWARTLAVLPDSVQIGVLGQLLTGGGPVYSLCTLQCIWLYDFDWRGKTFCKGRLVSSLRPLSPRVLALVVALVCSKGAHASQALDPNTWPFIPIPEVATNPNGGTTYGLMPVFLRHDSSGYISSIFALDINNNTTLGPGGGFRYLDYLSSDIHWSISGGAQLKKAHDIDLTYSIGRDRQQWWSFDGELFWEDDPTERFYGIGDHSSEGNEINYATKQVYFRGLLGINISEQFQIALEARPRFVRIGSGAFSSLPSPGDLFPRVKGLDGGSDIFNELVAGYDNRDSVDLPSRGGSTESSAVLQIAGWEAQFRTPDSASSCVTIFHFGNDSFLQRIR